MTERIFKLSAKHLKSLSKGLGSYLPSAPMAKTWDGDSLVWYAEGPRIQIAGVAAHELDGFCKPGHP